METEMRQSRDKIKENNENINKFTNFENAFFITYR